MRTAREYRAGREQGRHEGWWPDGTRQFLLRYDDGLLEGEAREWYPNGALYRLSTYHRGQEEGPQRMWNADGTLRASYDDEVFLSWMLSITEIPSLEAVLADIPDRFRDLCSGRD
mgnify:CR=1 FL=1